MKKQNLIEAVQSRLKEQNETYPKYEINRIFEPIFEEILETLQNGEEVHIHKFGNFILKHHRAKCVKHPKTKAKVHLPARISVVFTPTRSFTPPDVGTVKSKTNQSEKSS